MHRRAATILAALLAAACARGERPAASAEATAVPPGVARLGDFVAGDATVSAGAWTAPADTAAEYLRRSRLLGSVGPYVMVLHETYVYDCGAHGNTTMAFDVVTLDSTAPPRFWRPGIRGAAERSLARRARTQFAARPEGERPMTTDSLLVTALVPRYDAGRFTLHWQFTADACYACSDHRWSSYSVSEWVAVPRLPFLREWERVPGPVTAFFRENIPDSAGGWSRAGDTLVVWWHGAGAPRTAWLAPDGRELRRADGVHIAAAGRTWQWRERQTAVPTRSCDVYREATAPRKGE